MTFAVVVVPAALTDTFFRFLNTLLLRHTLTRIRTPVEALRPLASPLLRTLAHTLKLIPFLNSRALLLFALGHTRAINSMEGAFRTLVEGILTLGTLKSTLTSLPVIFIAWRAQLPHAATLTRVPFPLPISRAFLFLALFSQN